MGGPMTCQVVARKGMSLPGDGFGSWFVVDAGLC